MGKINIIETVSCLILSTTMISCAELSEQTDNQKHIRFIEKWVKVYGNNVEASGKGIYVLEESKVPSGTPVEEGDYVMLDYDASDLDGNINKTTDRATALKQNFQVKDSDHYGAEMTITEPGLNYAGLIEGLKGMTAGSTKRFLVPSWLMTTKNYATAGEYLNNKSDKGDVIYSVKVREVIKDHREYQNSLIKTYIEDNPQWGFVFENGMPKDTIEAGLYYKTLKVLPENPEGTGKKEENKEEKKYFDIDYVGTLIYKDYSNSGEIATRIFDTSIEKIAKDNSVWSGNIKYKPRRITWGENANDVKMDDNGVIAGFAKAIWKMKEEKAEEAVCIFISDHGYKASGSGKSIPGYAPIAFKINRVISEEEK